MQQVWAAGLAALAAAVAGCSSEAKSQDPGPITQRSYQVAGFDRIEVAGPYNVDVRTGSAPSASASGPEKMLEKLVVEVKDGALRIHPRKERGMNWHWTRNETVRIAVTLPQLHGASLAGPGDFTVDRIAGGDFEGDIAGSGGLHAGAVDVGSLKLAIAGSGDIKFGSGRAGNADYSIAGSGGIDAGKIQTQTAAVSIAGSGSVSGHATQTASVSIVGSGDVEMTGGAKCTVSKHGSGDVRCS